MKNVSSYTVNKVFNKELIKLSTRYLIENNDKTRSVITITELGSFINHVLSVSELEANIVYTDLVIRDLCESKANDYVLAGL